MNRRSVLSISTMTVLGLVLSSSASSQQKSLKDQLVGAWTPVSIKYKFPDGKTEDTMGPNARGILILDASGRMALVNMRASLPKFASNDRMKGTTEEYKAVGQGSFAYFGTYTVNEADRSLTFHIDGSTYPNFDGADQKRSFTLAGDELKYTNPVATVGQGVIVEAVWKRAK
jgi:Lipocalin-like domain